ncbi:hypothetical protein [Roseimaritima ulvae]|uniref:Uncharacterized protein n=1 Tax=Roseimaritima ulvae TaxID=980254 RepID=A0A5B9R0L9_9BACT|nr:hypothetical protein [Roseimaritima ulvae]QEG43799.1 hypothetical protein UC8_58550 [Roseimaritima ulvae]
MKTLEAPTAFQAYRVPRTDRSALIDPPLDSAAQLLADNARAAADWDIEFSGIAIADLRRQARADLLRAATHYTTRYRDYQGPTGTDAILLAGHQPQLFHPGVWFKNFALSHLATKLHATPINLVVDNDLRGSGSVRVPTRSSDGSIQATTVAYDDPGASVPLEQHRIANRNRFDSFDQRLAEAVQPWVSDPNVLELWPHARRAADRCENTGCALAGARHALEGQVGLQTLELPLSVVCRSRSFAAFLVGLISELPRLHECYNASVKQYRLAHGIRSSAHPVPLLGERDGWLEAPLWIYGDNAPQRRPVWVRANGDQLEISDLDGVCFQINNDPHDPQTAEQLFEAQSTNVKLRPRALITTMYSRLVLGDLFLHGIGGGKYDQLGDTIMRRFFEIEPPRFMVMSATVLLPGASHGGPLDVGEHHLRELREQIRSTRFNPQRFAGQAALPEELLRQHRELLQNIPQRGDKQAWHQQLQVVNDRLSANLDGTREQLQRRLAETQERVKQQQLLASREHPFCIYPLETLTATYETLLQVR